MNKREEFLKHGYTQTAILLYHQFNIIVQHKETLVKYFSNVKRGGVDFFYIQLLL